MMNDKAIGWLSVVGSGAAGASAAIMATDTMTTRVVVVAVLAFIVGCGTAARALYSQRPAVRVVDDPIPQEIKKPGVLLLPIALALGLSAATCSHGAPPDPNDPTAPPPAVDLPKDPLAPPFTTFYQRTDGGTKS